MPLINRIAAMADEITAWGHDFHEHPELLYEVHRTAGAVAEKLRAFGCDEVVPGVGKTGVVGVIHGRKRGSGKVVGLRADMDALPIQEITGLPYASKTPGLMHACGHDGHTAMLLGAAQYLAETRNFDGTAVVIFQPAEEGGGGGDAMVKDGLLERFRLQEGYGMDNMAGIPIGLLRGARHGLSQEVRPQHRRHGPQPLGLSQAAQLPGRDRGRHLLPQAGLRLGPLHLARARPLQGLCLVLGGGLQPRCLGSPATKLKPLRRSHEAANWPSPALPRARDYAGKLFPALIALSVKQNSRNTSTIRTQTLRRTLKPKVKPLVYGRKLD